MNMAIQGRIVRALRPYLVPEIEEVDDDLQGAAVKPFPPLPFSQNSKVSQQPSHNVRTTTATNVSSGERKCHLTKLPPWQKY